jgi:hypothetical protein
MSGCRFRVAELNTAVIARSVSDEAIQFFLAALDCFAEPSSGGHSPDPLARNDG